MDLTRSSHPRVFYHYILHDACSISGDKNAFQEGDTLERYDQVVNIWLLNGSLTKMSQSHATRVYRTGLL